MPSWCNHDEIDHLPHQGWSEGSNKRLMCIPVHPVGPRTSYGFQCVLAFFYFAPIFSSQLTILLLQALEIYTEIAAFHMPLNQLPQLHSSNPYHKSLII